MKLHKKPEIIPPEGGWKPDTYYVVAVSYHPNNPVHKKIFYSGFINKDGTPGSYNQFFEGNDDVISRNSTIQQIHYCKALHEIPWKIDNP